MTRTGELAALRMVAHEAVDRIFDQFEELPSQPLMKTASVKDVMSIESLATPRQTPQSAWTALDNAMRIFDFRVRLNHPRFFGFIPSPLSPVSWLGDMIASAFNAHAGSWWLSSGPTAVEKQLVSWLASRLGLPATAGGLFVSGGSMANLTAVICARDRRLDDARRELAVLYTSEQTHGSVAKACKAAGFLDSQIKQLPVNQHFQMDVSALSAAVKADLDAGLRPLAVIGSAGTTNTGAVDPLGQIADIAKSNGMWFHVDGAYGASVALSNKHRHLLQGIERADSVSWDPHKWLFQSYGCGVLLVRDSKVLLQTYSKSADYLRGAFSGDLENPNMWDYGLELTRPARSMKLWFTMQVLGSDLLGQMVDDAFPLAKAAENTLRTLRSWQIVSPASMGILSFRFAPEGLSDAELDKLNPEISDEAIASNTAGIFTTKVSSKIVLRICAIHPSLCQSQMEEVILALDDIARRLVAGQHADFPQH